MRCAGRAVLVEDWTDPWRVERYVERYFQEHGRTEWPTVRQVARALGLRQADVEQAVDGHPADNLELASYLTVVPEKLADHFVKTINPPTVGHKAEPNGDGMCRHCGEYLTKVSGTPRWRWAHRSELPR
jgi:hypothetical protein